MAYIDRDKLMKELSTMYKSPTSSEDFMTVGYDHAIADMVVTVHEQPTADVVEVVRCVNCKECETRHTANYLPFLFCLLNEHSVSYNAYCCWGREKETEDED